MIGIKYGHAKSLLLNGFRYIISSFILPFRSVQLASNMMLKQGILLLTSLFITKGRKISIVIKEASYLLRCRGLPESFVVPIQ